MYLRLVQVNICQKYLFLHQLTHNITTDCSLNYEISTWKFQAQNSVYINCSECQNKNKKQFVYTTCSELEILMYWTRNSMNNLLSYWRLVGTYKKKSFLKKFIYMFSGTNPYPCLNVTKLCYDISVLAMIDLYSQKLINIKTNLTFNGWKSNC